MDIVCILLGAFNLILFARILMSWFRRPYGGPMATVFTVVWRLTEPVLAPLRRLLPPMRMGMMALDLSPIIVFILLGIARRALGCGPVLGIF